MRTIIREIRNQPDHVRELAAILCTVIVVAGVGFVWFRSFQSNIYALLNPAPEAAQERIFARESRSLFGSILEVLGQGKAQILDLFGGEQVEPIDRSENVPAEIEAHPLPVSGNR